MTLDARVLGGVQSGFAVAASESERRVMCPYDLVKAARAMQPVLRERAPKAEQLRRIPDETIDDFHRAGLFRMLQPSRVGGYEVHPTVYMDVCAEIAKACASSAWVLSNLAIHHHFLALWDEQAQDDVWGASPDTLVGSSYIFTAGRAEAVEGGWRLSGRWPFSSGINPCEWAVVGASTAAAEDAPAERRYFLVPRSDYAIIDTWRVVGLQGTGSHDLEIDDVFVPAHRCLSFSESVGGKAPGLAINTAPLFRISMLATGGLTLLAILYGSARGAVDDYVADIRIRSGRVSGRGLADMTAVQTRIAEAEVNLDTVDLILRSDWERVMQAVNQNVELEAQEVVRLKRDAAFCARLCVSAVDAVFAGSGGGGLFERGALQRHWRRSRRSSPIRAAMGCLGSGLRPCPSWPPQRNSGDLKT